MQIMAKKMHFNVLFCARQNVGANLKEGNKNDFYTVHMIYLTSLCLFCILKTFIMHTSIIVMVTMIFNHE